MRSIRWNSSHLYRATPIKKSTRKRILYVALGLMVIVAAAGYGGFLYLKTQFFRQLPNTLTRTSTGEPISFLWSIEQHGEHNEEHAAMLVPVDILGLPKTLYMQFDTGSQYSFLRSKALKAFEDQGLPLDLYQEDDLYYVPAFAADLVGTAAV